MTTTQDRIDTANRRIEERLAWARPTAMQRRAQATMLEALRVFVRLGGAL